MAYSASLGQPDLQRCSRGAGIGSHTTHAHLLYAYVNTWPAGTRAHTHAPPPHTHTHTQAASDAAHSATMSRSSSQALPFSLSSFTSAPAAAQSNGTSSISRGVGDGAPLPPDQLWLSLVDAALVFERQLAPFLGAFAVG